MNRRALPLLLAGIVFASRAFASATLTVSPTIAPNFFGSPSFAGWGANAINALYTGQVSGGTIGTPTFYSALPNGSSINSAFNVVTNFPSWYGNANPAPGFTSEFGNRVHWSISVVATGGDKISLAGLDFTLNSTDGALLFASNFTAADNYSAFRVGVLYGTDGALGGGDDTFITSGSASQLVDALFYVGAGNAYEALTSDPGATNQDRIDIVASGIAGSFTADYNIPIRDSIGTVLGTASGSASLNVVTVPEPGTMLAGALPLAALLWRVQRRRR